MSSFSLDFDDDSILNILGDDIEIIDLNNTITSIKGAFEFRYMEDELGDVVGIHYPVVEVNNSDAHLFDKKFTVVFDNVQYKVLNKTPADMGKTLIILRNK